MIKQITAKQSEKLEAKIIAQAKVWLEKYPPEKVAMFVWNKYGYLAGTRNGKVTFKGRQGTVTVE